MNYLNGQKSIQIMKCILLLEFVDILQIGKVMDMNPINIPIAIKIPIDSGVDVQFNRESLTYNSLLKNILKKRLN